MALKGINTVIAKESYLDVGQFRIPLHKDTEYPATDYLDLDLAPRGNYQMEAAFPKRIISGHTITTRSALASRLLRSDAMGAVVPLATTARPLIVTSTTAPGLPALQTMASSGFLYAKTLNVLQLTTSTSSLPRGATTKRKKRSRRGSSRSTQ